MNELVVFVISRTEHHVPVLAAPNASVKDVPAVPEERPMAAPLAPVRVTALVIVQVLDALKERKVGAVTLRVPIVGDPLTAYPPDEAANVTML